MDYYVGTELYSGDALQHHGILGMKWGVRRSPEQLGYTNRHHGKGPKISKKDQRAANKRRKQRLTSLEKARKAAADKRTFEQRKKDALETGTAADILKFKGKLTNQEMQTAINRLNLEAQLSSIAQKNMVTAQQKFEKILKTAGNVSTALTTGTEAYNKIAKILNSVGDSDLPIIGEKKDHVTPKEIRDIILSADRAKVVENANKMNAKELQEAYLRLKTLAAIDKLDEIKITEDK